MIYRLSKYNPNYRLNGAYTHDEWTSVSDIGGTFETGRFTGLQYIETEAQYVLCLEALVGERNQSEFLIRDYERSGMLPLFTAVRLTLALRSGLYFFRGLKWRNNQVVEGSDVASFLVDCLRERCWGKLCSEGITVYFGYDYYSYVDTDLSPEEVKEIAHRHELFCELMEPSDD